MPRTPSTSDTFLLNGCSSMAMHYQSYKTDRPSADKTNTTLKSAISHLLDDEEAAARRRTGSKDVYDRREAGKKAAKALETMLKEPPHFKDVADAERIRDLDNLSKSPGFMERVRGWNGLILKSRKFDLAIGLVIVMNSIAIGVEQSLELGNNDLTVCELMENFFMTVYTVELGMQFLEEGFMALFYDRWLQLDTFLVTVGIMTTWLITPIMGSLRGLGPLFVIRTVRLLRLARMVRLLQQFKELWTLVHGFMSSFGTMTYTSGLLFLVIYGFSCLGMEVIRNHSAYGKDEQFTKIVDEHFANLPLIMLTLVRFTAMDSVGDIYTPLILKDGFLMLYFVGIILAVAIVLMNIVTAVIVNTALEANALDKEAKRVYNAQIRRMITEELGRMFEFFDEDDQGTISLAELQEAPPEAVHLLMKLTGVCNLQDIFMEVDTNGDGVISLDEFCQGLLRIVTSDLPHEVRHQHTRVQNDFVRLFDILDRLEHKIDKGLQRMKDIEHCRIHAEGRHSFHHEGKDRLHQRNHESHAHFESGSSTASTASTISPRKRIQKAYKPPKCTKIDECVETLLPASMPEWAANLLQELKQFQSGRDKRLRALSDLSMSPAASDTTMLKRNSLSSDFSDVSLVAGAAELQVGHGSVQRKSIHVDSDRFLRPPSMSELTPLVNASADSPRSSLRESEHEGPPLFMSKISMNTEFCQSFVPKTSTTKRKVKMTRRPRTLTPRYPKPRSSSDPDPVVASSPGSDDIIRKQSSLFELDSPVSPIEPRRIGNSMAKSGDLTPVSE